jgi:MraZ protein
VFRGRYEHAIDGKGRTSLPSRFREALSASGDARIVLTSGLERCLVAYPLSGWMAFEDKLAALPQFDASVTMLRRIYVSAAVECDVDKLGRVLVPAALRKHAGLSREVLWAGMGNHVELWDRAAFDGLRDEVLADPDKRDGIARRLAELGL